MSAFEAAGWQWIDAALAFEDPFFASLPQTLPAGESLVWALAKETGRFENRSATLERTTYTKGKDGRPWLVIHPGNPQADDLF